MSASREETELSANTLLPGTYEWSLALHLMASELCTHLSLLHCHLLLP